MQRKNISLTGAVQFLSVYNRFNFIIITMPGNYFTINIIGGLCYGLWINLFIISIANILTINIKLYIFRIIF